MNFAKRKRYHSLGVINFETREFDYVRVGNVEIGCNHNGPYPLPYNFPCKVTTYIYIYVKSAIPFWEIVLHVIR